MQLHVWYLTRGGTLTVFIYYHYWMNYFKVGNIHACYIHIHTLLELCTLTEMCNPIPWQYGR